METNTHGSPTNITRTGEHRYYMAMDTGWRQVIAFSDMASEMVGIHYEQLSIYGLQFEFDPEQNLLYGCEVIQSGASFIPIDSNRFVYAVDNDGNIQWKVVDAPKIHHGYSDSVKAVIPIAEKEFLAVYPASQRHLKDTVVMEQSSLLQMNGKVEYQRYLTLRNKRYLRCYSTPSAPNTLQMEVFSHSGKLLDSTSLQFNVPASRVAIVQNPTDRSLALLYGGAGGAKLTLLSERLRVQQDLEAGKILLQDYPISTTRDTVGLVAGIFRNDTLFAVWEDFRNGKPDIYSTGWQTPENIVAPLLQPPSSSISASQPLAITAVAPIPCNDQLIVQHQLAEAGIVTFDIMDEMGRSVKQITKKLPQGLSESHLVTDDLFPGMYVVRVRSQYGEAMMRFLVVR